MKKRAMVVLDILGISSATFCLIHCLLFPVLAIIPVGFSDNHWIDIFFACIGMFVVSKIIFSKATSRVKIILSISIVAIIIGVVLEIIYYINTNMVVIGGVGMIIGHLLNFKNHKH